MSDPGPVIIPTERGTVELRRLTGFDDAFGYHEAVRVNKEHLSQFGDDTYSKRDTFEKCLDPILEPDDPGKERYGIWSRRAHLGDQFVGSINLTPHGHFAEIGYWLDRRFLGHGYASIATRALAQNALRRFAYLLAETHPDNMASQRVLEHSGFKRFDHNARSPALFIRHR